jgi:taurine dioxygenase
MDGYRTIDVVPVAARIGAQVDGVDLTSSLSEAQVAEIHDALMRHLVLFFRGQDLTDEQHIAFAARFGVPNIYPPNRARGIIEPLEWIEDSETSPPKTDLWHTDVAFMPKPPEVAVLNMRAAAPVGGDTLWLNLYEVHDALSPVMQELVAGLELDLHPGDDMKTKLELQFGPGIFEEVEAEFSGCLHPLVRVHPVTGRRALFMCGRYVKGLAGLHPAESETLLRLLAAGLEDPNFQCRWRWQDFDVAVWDERCTNHRALSDHYPEHRLVRRCTVGASAPFGPYGPDDVGVGALVAAGDPVPLR